MPEKIAFGSITDKGLPFYGGAISYTFPIETKACDIVINAALYSGALIEVKVDGKEVGKIIYAPFELEVKDLCEGKHTVTLTLYNTRVNTFNGLHDCVERSWKGPNMYYTKGNEWSYEYDLTVQGILKSPVVKVYNK